MGKILYPEHQVGMKGIENVSAEGKIRFFIRSAMIKDVRPHHHDFVEFTYFAKGSGFQIINGVRHPFNPGTVSFTLPHHIHSVESTSDKSSLKYCCFFDLQLLFGTQDDSELSRLLYGIGPLTPSFADLDGKEHERVMRLIEELLQEYRQPNSVGNFYMVRAKLTELILLFIRANSTSGNPWSFTTFSRQSKKNWFSYLQHYVHSHYADSLTLDDLARHFGISAAHISRSFKELIGQNFIEYLHHIRVESACSMMLHTNMTISEIGLAVGFESFRSFSRVFREMKGVTAREYRKRAAELR